MAFRISEGNFIEQIIELAAGYGIGNAVSAALEPLVQSERNRLWALDPSMPTDPQTLALLVRIGAVELGAATAEAAKTGTGPDSLKRYVRSLQAPPDVSTLLTLSQRGELPAAGLAAHLERAGVDPRYAPQVASLRRQILSPQEAALLRQRGHLSAGEQYAIAALGGVDEHDAELQFQGSGISMGVGMGLELIRRGEMTHDRFRQLVSQADTRVEWTDDLLKLTHVPLSPAVAAEAVVRERHLPRDPHYYATAAGLTHEDFDAWVSMLGRPMGIMEALRLVNRGEMDERGFREVVARSDVRTEYTDQLLKLRVNYPSLFQLGRLIANSSIPDDYALEILRFEGYPQKLAEGVVHAAHKTKTAHHKTISLSLAEQLYEAGLENKEWFDRVLDQLGYDETDRADLENALEVRRIVGEVTHAINMLRSRYVGWKIGRDIVVKELDELLTDAEIRGRLLALWDLEREANRPVLTKGEIGQALRYGRFTVDEAVQHWVDIGMSQDDAVTHAWISLRRNPYQKAA